MVVFCADDTIEKEMLRHEIIQIFNTTFEEEPVKIDSDTNLNILASIQDCSKDFIFIIDKG